MKVYFIENNTKCPTLATRLNLMSVLAKYYEITSNIEEADYIIADSCMCTQVSINAAIKTLDSVFNNKSSHAKVLVAGCAASMGKYYNLERDDVIIIPDKNIDAILKFLKLDEPLNQGRFNYEFDYRLEILLTIGCLRKCSFCKMNYMDNGNQLKSLSLEEISNILASAPGIPYSVTLSGVNTTEYGLDLAPYGKPKLHQVIEMLNNDSRVKWIFINGLHPGELYDNRELISALLNNPKIKSLHIAVESASDKILKLMNKGFTKAQLDFLFTLFRAERPEIYLDVHVLAGFPTEASKDREETFAFLAKHNLPLFYKAVNMYGNTAGAPSSLLPQFDDAETSMIEDEYSEIQLMAGQMMLEHPALNEGLVVGRIEAGKNPALRTKLNIGEDVVYLDILTKLNMLNVAMQPKDREYNIGDVILSKRPPK